MFKPMRTVLAAMMLPAALTAQTADSTSVEAVAQVKVIYEGKAGGALCFTCHGPAGKGVPGLGADLTDDTWLHGDGGFAFLQQIIRTGVPKPRQAMTIMPPMGGGTLTQAQLAALAAYVKTLD